MSAPLGPATQATLGALNASLAVGVQNSGKTGVQVTGTFTGTLSFFGDLDGSTNVAINAFPIGAGEISAEPVAVPLRSATPSFMLVFTSPWADHHFGDAFLEIHFAFASFARIQFRHLHTTMVKFFAGCVVLVIVEGEDVYPLSSSSYLAEQHVRTSSAPPPLVKSWVDSRVDFEGRQFSRSRGTSYTNSTRILGPEDHPGNVPQSAAADVCLPLLIGVESDKLETPLFNLPPSMVILHELELRPLYWPLEGSGITDKPMSRLAEHVFALHQTPCAELDILDGRVDLDGRQLRSTHYQLLNRSLYTFAGAGQDAP
jgi:hypothetical protein